jgi:hypothetical protein
MTPGENNIDEPLGDFSLCQERLQEHDLDRIGPGNREKGTVGQ